jgi:hypothetical protein
MGKVRKGKSGRVLWGVAALAALVVVSAGRTQPASGASSIEPGAGGSSGLAGIVLTDQRNQPVHLDALVAAHRLTVVVFYAAGCPCFAAHVPRLVDLARAHAGDDVAFVVVDSERHAPPEPGAPTIAIGSRLLGARDAHGTLARRLDARFATETFVFDSAQRLRYRGGIDGDRKYLTSKPQTHLGNALRALVAGTAPLLTTSKALGCALKLL